MVAESIDDCWVKPRVAKLLVASSRAKMDVSKKRRRSSSFCGHWFFEASLRAQMLCNFCASGA
jgi:hypothetical protein